MEGGRLSFMLYRLLPHNVYFQCLGTGRPPLFAAHVIDCEFPIDKNKIIDEEGNVYESSESSTLLSFAFPIRLMHGRNQHETGNTASRVMYSRNS